MKNTSIKLIVNFLCFQLICVVPCSNATHSTRQDDAKLFYEVQLNALVRKPIENMVYQATDLVAAYYNNISDHVKIQTQGIEQRIRLIEELIEKETATLLACDTDDNCDQEKNISILRNLNHLRWQMLDLEEIVYGMDYFKALFEKKAELPMVVDTCKHAVSRLSILDIPEYQIDDEIVTNFTSPQYANLYFWGSDLSDGDTEKDVTMRAAGIGATAGAYFGGLGALIGGFLGALFGYVAAKVYTVYKVIVHNWNLRKQYNDIVEREKKRHEEDIQKTRQWLKEHLNKETLIQYAKSLCDTLDFTPVITALSLQQQELYKLTDSTHQKEMLARIRKKVGGLLTLKVEYDVSQQSKFRTREMASTRVDMQRIKDTIEFSKTYNSSLLPLQEKMVQCMFNEESSCDTRHICITNTISVARKIFDESKRNWTNFHNATKSLIAEKEASFIIHLEEFKQDLWFCRN